MVVFFHDPDDMQTGGMLFGKQRKEGVSDRCQGDHLATFESLSRKVQRQRKKLSAPTPAPSTAKETVFPPQLQLDSNDNQPVSTIRLQYSLRKTGCGFCHREEPDPTEQLLHHLPGWDICHGSTRLGSGVHYQDFPGRNERPHSCCLLPLGEQSQGVLQDGPPVSQGRCTLLEPRKFPV